MVTVSSVIVTVTVSSVIVTVSSVVRHRHVQQSELILKSEFLNLKS